MAFGVKMRYFLLPEILWTGISVAFYSGVLVNMMSLSLKSNDSQITNEDMFYKTLMAMTLFGGGEILGCLFIG